MKILVTGNWGAGWSSWNNNKNGLSKFLATYSPLIDLVEQRWTERENLSYGETCYTPVIKQDEPIILELQKIIKEKFETNAYLGGCENLSVIDVELPVRIRAIDGKEKVISGRDVFSSDKGVIIKNDDDPQENLS